jgi:hypothetical protein
MGRRVKLVVMVDYERLYWSKAKESSLLVVFLKRLIGSSFLAVRIFISFHLCNDVSSVQGIAGVDSCARSRSYRIVDRTPQLPRYTRMWFIRMLPFVSWQDKPTQRPC